MSDGNTATPAGRDAALERLARRAHRARHDDAPARGRRDRAAPRPTGSRRADAASATASRRRADLERDQRHAVEPSSISRRTTSIPSAPANSADRRLVPRDLGRQPRPLGDVREVRQHRVERPATPSSRSASHELHVEPEPRRVRARHRQRVLADVHAEHREVRPLVLQRERHRAAAGPDVGHPRARRQAPAPTSTSSSVSGRGISTRRSTVSEIRRNSFRPRMYATGSRASRRTISASNRSTPRRRAARRVEHETPAAHPERRGEQQLGVEPRRVAAGACQPSRGASASAPRTDVPAPTRLRQPPAPPAAGASRRPVARR